MKMTASGVASRCLGLGIVGATVALLNPGCVGAEAPPPSEDAGGNSGSNGSSSSGSSSTIATMAIMVSNMCVSNLTAIVSP
jgi:hypothetical protein